VYGDVNQSDGNKERGDFPVPAAVYGRSLRRLQSREKTELHFALNWAMQRQGRGKQLGKEALSGKLTRKLLEENHQAHGTCEG